MKKPISRRRLLRGMGVAMALPFLEAMESRKSVFSKMADNDSPLRTCFVYVPCGAIMKHWTPKNLGLDFELSKTLRPLERHKNSLNILSGLSHDAATSPDDEGGEHARDSATFLTAKHAKKTEGPDVVVGVSLDQKIATKIGSQTRIPSLVLGIEPTKPIGTCDPGYSCIYHSCISWRDAFQPMVKEVNPKIVFQRLFGDPLASANLKSQREISRRSVLDFVAEDANSLLQLIGSSDKNKLEEYLDSVRAIERQIELSQKVTEQSRVPIGTAPTGVPDKFSDHVRLMYDLIKMAFLTDTTRVCTLMLGNAGTSRSFPELNIENAYHELTHHQGDEDKIKLVQRIDQYFIEQFEYFLDELAATRDGSGTLLEHSAIVYGGAISDPNRHLHDNLPVLLAGTANGRLKSGQHLGLAGEPMANLFMSLLDLHGVHESHFGDSDGDLNSQLRI